MQSVHSGRLLILEDNPSVGSLIRTIALSCGLEARVLSHPEGFFRAVSDWQPTHIVLDLVIPKMDGVEVLVELAALQCPATIIIASGMGNRVLHAAARTASEHGLHVGGVLAKPFSAAALRALLRRVPDAPRNDARTTPCDEAAKPFEFTAADLRHGIENQELWIAYQPKIECAAGALAGFEALVRWTHPQHGLVMPDRFISFAEKHGLMDALTHSVLDQALRWFAAHFLRKAPASRLRSSIALSINLSATSLNDTTALDRIMSCCRKHRMPSRRLILELTETSAMKNPMTSLATLTRMRMKGFQLSIDDFGSGYSSMRELVRMPFSEIKVDKSFVMSATRSAESRAAVKSIVDLGRSLGLKSAAEGVEDAKTLELIKDLGCDFAQGNWIGRPMHGSAIADWMSNRRDVLHVNT